MGLFTKDIKTMNDLFVHQLQDIYYAEKQLVKMLWGERRGHGTFGAVFTATDGVPHVAGLSF